MTNELAEYCAAALWRDAGYSKSWEDGRPEDKQFCIDNARVVLEAIDRLQSQQSVPPEAQALVERLGGAVLQLHDLYEAEDDRILKCDLKYARDDIQLARDFIARQAATVERLKSDLAEATEFMLRQAARIQEPIEVTPEMVEAAEKAFDACPASHQRIAIAEACCFRAAIRTAIGWTATRATCTSRTLERRC